MCVEPKHSKLLDLHYKGVPKPFRQSQATANHGEQCIQQKERKYKNNKISYIMPNFMYMAVIVLFCMMERCFFSLKNSIVR